MKYLTGEDRRQISLIMGCLEEAIEADHEVRLIDAFVEALPLGDFGFKVDHLEIGRPAYNPADLLKLYLYGYLNRSRCGHDVHSLQPASNLQPFAPKRAPSLPEEAWPHFWLRKRLATRIRLRCAECWPKQDNRSNNFCASLTTHRNALY